MFGHDDQAKDQAGQNDNADAPVADASLGDQNSGSDATQSAPALNNDAGDASSQDYIMTDPPAQSPATDAPNDDSAPSSADDTPASVPGTTTTPTPASSDLLDIKQQALQQLTPLVGHLDQTPEEKFRTTMMMIQASDNDTLVKEAYAAAQQITDEKARAQALLDIVNEINYFTQNQDQEKLAAA